MRAAEETAKPGQPLSPVRRTIAERLYAGYHAAVPVTLTRAVDATELVDLRARILADLADGAPRPTFTDFFAWIAAHCLRRHGALNGTYDGERLFHAPKGQLALAMDTPRGLVAPVLRPPDLADLGTIANLPTSPSVFEIQILSTDAVEFDGTGLYENVEPVIAVPSETDDPDAWASATVSVPPMGGVWLRYEG